MGEVKDQWVSVKDRLPKPNLIVLTLDKFYKYSMTSTP